MTLRITHSSLTKLEASQAWVDSGFQGSQDVTAEGIYGPEGRLQWLWPLEWGGQDDMRSSLCANMGGGIPISIIEAFLAICVEEEGR